MPHTALYARVGCCPRLQSTASCNMLDCPVDCVMNPWTAWGSCTLTCGTGVATRTRDVQQPALYGGVACSTNVQETQNCNMFDCPVDCVVSSWGSFGDCSQVCDGGIQTRTRTISQPVAYGGVTCPTLQDTQVCNTQDCIPCGATAESATIGQPAFLIWGVM